MSILVPKLPLNLPVITLWLFDHVFVYDRLWSVTLSHANLINKSVHWHCICVNFTMHTTVNSPIGGQLRTCHWLKEVWNLIFLVETMDNFFIIFRHLSVKQFVCNVYISNPAGNDSDLQCNVSLVWWVHLQKVTN